jgi:peroxiredoxin
LPLALGAAFPSPALLDEHGREARLSAAWAEGEALIAVGHSGCRTTRLALPYVDRLHQRRAPGARVVAVLQDTPEDARALRDDLRLELPLWLEPDPYPLAAALGLTLVPTLFVVGRDGRVAAVCEAFRRAELESFAARWGAAPLFEADDPAPALRPG